MDPIARMIDANANRAREALRVLEDCARFALDDAALTEECKALRHALRDAAGALPIDRAAMLASRRSDDDVGAALSTPGEMARSSLRDVAGAAGARLGEALRVIEECAKSLGAPDAARTIEAARYRGYEASRRIETALGAGRAPQWRVCVLLTESLCAGRPWQDVAAGAIEGGADCLQLREKALEDGELLRRARLLVDLARSTAGAGGRPSVIINDRPDIALLAGADGAHLGRGDLPLREAQALVGGRLLLGVSTSTVDEAAAAARDGADYCGVGPMFPSTTKVKDRIAGPAAIEAYVRNEPALPPHLAIGGITPQNIGEVANAGAMGVAVSSCVCGAEDPAAAVRALRDALTRRSTAGAG